MCAQVAPSDECLRGKCTPDRMAIPWRRLFLAVGTWKTREWKTRYQTAGVENAGVENAVPDCRGGKRGSLKSMKSEDFENVFLTVLTERIVWKLAQTLLLNKGGLSRDDFLAS